MNIPTGRFELSNRIFNLLIIFLVVITGYWGFKAYEVWKTDPSNYPRELYVEETAKTSIAPDIAKVTLGVSTEAKTSEQAVNDNSAKMNAVTKTLKEAGIEEKDIKTMGYYLNPKYTVPGIKGGVSVQDGFSLEQTLEVTIRDFSKVGDIIAKSSGAGANTVGGVNFQVEDPDAAKAKVREQAIAKAKEKAKMIAEQAGLDLGKVINYNEYDGSTYDYGKGGYAEGAVMDSTVPPMAPNIQPGQQEIALTVNLTFRVR